MGGFGDAVGVRLACDERSCSWLKVFFSFREQIESHVNVGDPAGQASGTPPAEETLGLVACTARDGRR
jgi:hypothetical protein